MYMARAQLLSIHWYIGFLILHQIFTNKTKSTCIHELHIRSASLGKFLTHSSSCLITEIAKCCETRVLEVSTPTLLLEDVVSLKNQLVELMFYVEENQAAIERFMPTLLYDNKALKQLKLYGNGLSDDSIEALAEALKAQPCFGNVAYSRYLSSNGCCMVAI